MCCQSSKVDMSIYEEKMKNHVPPTEKEKSELQHQIGLLNEKDHLFLFTEIIQNMEKKCYTITENCTLFDLNDLDPEMFWKMFYHTHFFLENNQRHKEIEKAQQECSDVNDQLHQKMETDLLHIKNQTQCDEVTPTVSLTEYEKLRIEALQQCSYSNYAPLPFTTSSNQKSIYSDNCHRKWKQSTKSDEIAKKVTKISSRNNIHSNSEQSNVDRLNKQRIQIRTPNDFYRDKEIDEKYTQLPSSPGHGSDNMTDLDDEDDRFSLTDPDEIELTREIEHVKPKPKVKITLRSQIMENHRPMMNDLEDV